MKKEITPDEIERLTGYEEDVKDEFKELDEAKRMLKDAEDWFFKRKVRLAESIIKLHNYKKEIYGQEL